MEAGIYRIRNVKNNDCYIGSTGDLVRRKKEHFRLLKQNKSHCTILQRAYNKYGDINFIFEVIAYCPNEYLFKLEQWFVDTLTPKYNICKIVVSCTKGYKHSHEAKIKIGRSNKLKTNKNFGWKSRAIVKIDSDGSILQEYKSLKEYALEHKCAIGSVGKALKKGHKCKGYYIRYSR